MNELLEFHYQLIADVQGDADAMGLVTAEAFFEKVADLLSEAGEVDEADRAYYEGKYAAYQMQVDGYGGDPIENSGVLTLMICDFGLNDEVRVLNRQHIEKLQNRLYRFLVSSLKPGFKDQLEETSSGFGLADLISTRWNTIEKIKLVIATNGNFSARSDAESLDPIDGKPITLSVWDLKRLKQFMDQGQARADLQIDFERDFGGGIPLLKASGGDGSLESYLAVIPGKQLAAVYEKWGPRLLEANVRSFLQARGKVNQGIRNTIRDEPHMFFSYNNGLSATADGIELKQAESGLELVRADNLQIVNGGQTTASLHAAKKLFEEQLDQVHVQMKLTIVPSSQSEEVVPRISEYANSQNKVNAADFFANHPFHIRVEEYSRRLLAPAGEDGYRETKWFYERARGQYADERGRRTPAERKKFDAEYPRGQFFTKTDLAKYENTFECLPHIVSRGAQKNFAEFAKSIGKQWGKDGSVFNELWYKRLVSKNIIFKTMERLVSSADWYEGGYRANIVTYGISKVVHDAMQKGKVIDLDMVWKSQAIAPELKAMLLAAGEVAQDAINNPPAGVRNASEWAKKDICWKWLSEKEVVYPGKTDRVIISLESARSRAKEAKSEAALDQSVNAEIEVHTLGSEFWKVARDWARERAILSPKELGVLETCSAIPRKMPSERQCAVALTALQKLKEEGFSD
ncbi:MAG: AIPR family protein [Alteromonadaceae bacterium]|uniref:AIPR family protein n=1 Tax=Marinobacter sp. TaxID=50741 RepID=UPI0029C4999C|nr:AIPR family protein [Marinobacter sp.]MDX5388400.1 AIPR family protein [Marinobacter sp.]MDX5441039.1 AIPR family protein [Alteromonadaceae bacterium]